MKIKKTQMPGGSCKPWFRQAKVSVDSRHLQAILLMDNSGTTPPKASDAASKILQELGVKNSKKPLRPRPRIRIPGDTVSKQSPPAGSSTPRDEQNETVPANAKFRQFLLKLGYAALLGLSGFIILLLTGGHLNLLDRSLFQQLVEYRLHQLEFTEDLRTRLVDNFFNREPLVVLEGNVRNFFSTNDDVGQIKLKALAFDSGNRLLESRTTYAGILLNDEELKQLSRSEILRLFELNRGRDVPNHGLFRFQDLPFQTVFFTSGKQVAHTSVQIVSYLRNGEMVYVNTPDPKS